MEVWIVNDHGIVAMLDIKKNFQKPVLAALLMGAKKPDVEKLIKRMKRIGALDD